MSTVKRGAAAGDILPSAPTPARARPHGRDRLGFITVFEGDPPPPRSSAPSHTRGERGIWDARVQEGERGISS